MLRRHGTLLTLALLLCGTAMSGETPDVDVGATAPAIKGKTWFSTDSKAPELKGKVHLIDFWFAG